jgi:phytoene dehydrogenase-like protein
MSKEKGRDHEPKLTEAEGFAAIALLAVRADGVVVPEEAAGLATTLARMRLYKGWTSAKVSSTLNKLVELLKKEGNDVVLRVAVASLRDELRETAYAVAADLIMADHVVLDLEEVQLQKIQKELGLSKERAARIFEILMVKNRG